MANKENKKKMIAGKNVVMKAPVNRPPSNFNAETTQQSVPINTVYEEYGIIQTYKDCYVKSFYIGDNNYMTAPEEEQWEMYEGYRRFLNSFGSEVEFAITVNNRTMNENDIREANMLKETGDKYDHLRKEMNEIILDRVAGGKNSIKKDKYLTVAIHEATPKKAYDVFQVLGKDLNETLNKIGSSATPIALEDMLEILYGIYNDPSEHFIQKRKVFNDDGQTVEVSSFDFDNMRNMGLTINDLIGPTSIEIQSNKMRIGKKWVRAFRLSDFPSQMGDEFLSNVTDMNFDCMTTVNYNSLSGETAERMVNVNIALLGEEEMRQRRAGMRNNIYDDSCVNQVLLEQKAEALQLREDMHSDDEKLFKVTLSVVIFAETEELLEQYTRTLMMEYKKASAPLTVMLNQQEIGFNSTLPLCYNQINARRTLKSSSAAILLPFSILELNDAGGINYSCNLISRNLLVYDRLSSQNFNGFILGTPGSGKSFTAKVEMLNVFLKSNADIFVIDPENEYTALAQLLGGEIIKIEPGGKHHINPLEIANTSTDDGVSPLNAKSDFMLRLCECMLKSPLGTNSAHETIVDEEVHALYKDYLEEDGSIGYIPPEDMPTLTDLQKRFERRREAEARELSMALKLYTGEGSLNVFGEKTNVNTHSRFVVYQIKDVGDRLKNVAMLTILDHIWNKIVDNRKIGKPTWFYVDEIYLLFQNEYSAEFLNTLFRRARKYMGVPTGITQNVSTLLESSTARDMLQNCNFIQILKQAGPDRDRLQDLLNLSDTQIGYITSSPKGQGLIYTGSAVVPFYSNFPKNNDCYKALTSDAREIKQIEAEKKRKEARKNKQ